MIISADKLEPVFLEVKKVNEAIALYCLAPDKIPVSKADVQFAIEELYGIKIRTHIVPTSTDLVRGMILIYEGEAKVIIAAELNTAWTRFVFVKELSHIMIKNGDNCTNDPNDIIEWFVQDGPQLDDKPASADVLSEELAKIAAVELLFPYKLRAQAKERARNGSDTLFTLSEWLEIPEHLVEYALSDRYIAFAKRMWDRVQRR